MDETLSVEQAYNAMLHFLEANYGRGFEEELGGLLGGFAINPEDGKPMDPGAWEDWTSAVAKALAEGPLLGGTKSAYDDKRVPAILSPWKHA